MVLNRKQRRELQKILHRSGISKRAAKAKANEFKTKEHPVKNNTEGNKANATE